MTNEPEYKVIDSRKIRIGADKFIEVASKKLAKNGYRPRYMLFISKAVEDENGRAEYKHSVGIPLKINVVNEIVQAIQDLAKVDEEDGIDRARNSRKD